MMVFNSKKWLHVSANSCRLQVITILLKEYHIYAYILRHIYDTYIICLCRHIHMIRIYAYIGIYIWYSLSKIVITWRWPLLAETCSYFFAIKHHHKNILPQLWFHDWYLPHHKLTEVSESDPLLVNQGFDTRAGRNNLETHSLKRRLIWKPRDGTLNPTRSKCCLYFQDSRSFDEPLVATCKTT